MNALESITNNNVFKIGKEVLFQGACGAIGAVTVSIFVPGYSPVAMFKVCALIGALSKAVFLLLGENNPAATPAMVIGYGSGVMLMNYYVPTSFIQPFIASFTGLVVAGSVGGCIILVKAAIMNRFSSSDSPDIPPATAE